MNYMPPHILEPVNGLAHTNTFILLHGRSSTAEEFANDFFSLTTSKAGTNLRSRFPTWRWVFPDAGMRWCTSFQDKRSAWFDTFSLEDLREKEALQIEGLRDGVHLVREIVEEEVGRLGGHAEKVILGGFSQGSAVALWSVFTGAAMTKGTLGAFVGLSAWMPFTKEAKEAVVPMADPSTMRIGKLATVFADILGIGPFMQVEAMQERLQMPVYLGHGIDDVVVSMTNCHDISSVFAAIGVKVDAQEYVGADRDGHWIKTPEQVNDIVEFLVCSLGEC